MDSMSINDFVFECIRAIVLLTLLGILFFRGSFTSLARHPGWKLILTGFCLITAANLLDLTDEIPGLEKYVIIGDTIYEALLEKLPGYLLGFVLLLVGFYKMIPSLQKYEEQEQSLQESEERLRQIFVANPDPVILARLESGLIVDVNPAFEQQTGFQRSAVLGRNSADLDLWVDPEQRETFRQHLIGSGIVDNFEADFKLQNGQQRPGLLSARIVRLGGEECILIVIRDISRIKQAEQALIEVDQMRKDFISTAAHELRTPITVLVGYAELLTDPEQKNCLPAAKREEFLAEIKDKGLVLSQIVDDLLDLSRIDAGLKFELQRQKINPDRILLKAFEQFGVQHAGHTFDVDLEGSENLQVDCDPRRLTQIIDNLCSNAVKYSPPGSRITLASCQTDDSYQFAIKDNGHGMTAEQIERMFDKFYRVDSSDTAATGLGLGMSIVKQLVDLHGGGIRVDSTPGRGTAVTVSLPVAGP